MMAMLGFSPNFCRWIKACISTVSYSVLLNGKPTRYILPQRGLRQGYPLSPYLFLLCSDGLTALLINGMERGSIHGVRVAPYGLVYFSSIFADDSVLFCEASANDARGVRDILDIYAAGSGQEINVSKSSIFYGAKVKKSEKKAIECILKIQSKAGFGKYLGLQADFGL